ncbi:MAG: adaptor protein MecA [Streptococcus sanguinis]|uniref:Adapter protein MecA n=1 Tax=Streptococcus sanguinis TaxID=1305 RepID=A0A2X4AGF0_STRSA|nr:MULTISPECIES: adaptor protein MecA [Streptococcus]MBF1690604.1 adaptor protein MecA [Streptococcus cristatus]MBF1698391.1 adaptor protein MecA [Streptococcus cristatus]MBF1699877.1 adaptor protein MecA [Streptococcus sanguinis]MBZ2057620.1 adaptor protein MecA [Streptococcus sanguinis]RSI04900.1 Adapter protein MecA [Streptococcus sanguinis]
MEMKQISDSTIKITIQLEDLEERGMEMADFLVPQEKTEEFFYTILDELEMPDNFLDSGMLSFRVTPKPDKVDVFVTKSKLDKNLSFEDLADLPDMDELSHMSPDEFLKTLEKSIFEKSKEDIEAVQSLETAEAEEGAQFSQQAADEQLTENAERYIYYILRFEDIKAAAAFAQTVDYKIDLSELYKHDSAYYLTILVDVEGFPERYPAWLLAKMREFADDSDITRAVLQEHGHLLLVTDAVSGLQKVECL